MASGGGCNNCGKVFTTIGPDHPTCFKCIKRKECGQDAAALAAVKEQGQCVTCGVVYIYLAEGEECGTCSAGVKLNKTTATSKKSKENATAKRPIEIIDDSSDSDIAVQPAASGSTRTKTALDIRVQQQKNQASTIRLTEKDPNHALVLSQKFLEERNSARKHRVSPKAASILFKFNVLLLKQNGKTDSTRASAQSRGFSLDDNMAHVLAKLLNMVNEPDSQWMKQYSGKQLQLEDVKFTFRDGVEIGRKYTTAQTTVASFWTTHTQVDNQYFKKGSIAASTAEITIRVPIEFTYDPSESDAEEILEDIKNTNRKRERKAVSKLERGKKRIKFEPVEASIKSEPAEARLPASGKVPKVHGPPVTLRITTPITFTKEKYMGTFAEPETSENIHGKADVTRGWSDELKTHFQLSQGDEHYLARRLEQDGFRFSPENELSAARAELIRGHTLKGILDDLVVRYGEAIPELRGYSSPELFIATCTDRGTILGHLVCQPRPAIRFNAITKGVSDILDAISHYSYIDANAEWVLEDFKVADSADGSRSVFAPIVHSIGADSGLYDKGPDALAAFKDLHICNRMCEVFELKPFQSA